jgi:hypothetical protein
MLLTLRRKARRARALTRHDLGILARSWFLLLFIDMGLRLLPFKKVQAFLQMEASAPSTSANPAPEIHRLAVLTGLAARHHLYPMTCLRRSLALQRLLARCGLAVDLRLGVRKQDGALQAHAWLEWGGQPVGEADLVLETYAPLQPHEAAS